jgi:hypothetical protein
MNIDCKEWSCQLRLCINYSMNLGAEDILENLGMFFQGETGTISWEIKRTELWHVHCGVYENIL